MLTKKVEDLLNRQIGREAYSSWLYLAMASWAQAEGYAGTALWLYAQAEEEKVHMLKLIHYVNDRGGKALIDGVEKPPQTFDGIRPMFDQVLKHEQFVTQSINEIVTACNEEGDHTTHNWLQWFVAEQIEEENSAKDIIDRLKLVGDHNMYMFDRDIMFIRGASESGDTEQT